MSLCVCVRIYAIDMPKSIQSAIQRQRLPDKQAGGPAYPICFWLEKKNTRKIAARRAP